MQQQGQAQSGRAFLEARSEYANLFMCLQLPYGNTEAPEHAECQSSSTSPPPWDMSGGSV